MGIPRKSLWGFSQLRVTMHSEKRGVHCGSQNRPHLCPLRWPGSSRAGTGADEMWMVRTDRFPKPVCLRRVEWAGPSGHTDERREDAQVNKWPCDSLTAKKSAEPNAWASAQDAGRREGSEGRSQGAAARLGEGRTGGGHTGKYAEWARGRRALFPCSLGTDTLPAQREAPLQSKTRTRNNPGFLSQTGRGSNPSASKSSAGT